MILDGVINYELFLLSSFLIIAIPGQDFFYVMTRGMHLGKRAGLVAVGISFGLMIHTLLAALGLSIIIQSSTVVYALIQYCGSAYLIYLGVRTLMSKEEQNTIKPITISRRNIFVQGVLTNLFNPKALLVFLAFLPQFVAKDYVYPTRPLVLLGITLSLLALAWFCLIGYFAGAIGSLIKNNKQFQVIVKMLSGSILVALGVRLSLQK